jgi:MtrB/PioB family decaheme-associated outer membrane protein
MSKLSRTQLVAPLLALTVVGGPALAAPDTSSWECKRCPFEEGYSADTEAGATNVSDDAFRYGNYTGYDEKGTYLNLDGQGRYADDGYQLSWMVEDLGLDSRVVGIEGGRQGTFGFGLEYRELPERVYDSTVSPYSQTNDSVLTLPSDWVRAGSTAGMSALPAALLGRNIESDRDVLEIGGEYLPSTRFRLFADYRRQEQEGTAISAGSFYTNGTLLPRPFDYATDEVDVGVRYGGSNSQVTLAYYGSFFQNQAVGLTWDNAFSGADRGRLGEPADSKFQQVSLSASYAWVDYATTVSFVGAMGRGEQDDYLLPYTINPGLAAPALPTRTLDAEVDTTNLALTVTSRPLPKARVRFSYHYDDRDNKTSQYTWTRVVTDTFLSAEEEQNRPYSFERSRIGLSGDYDLFDSLTLSGGVERYTIDRTFQEVESQDEDTGWGKLAWQPSGWFEIAAKGGAAEREADGYDTNLAASFGQNPFMRKYHLAYRYREFGEVTAMASVPEKPISFAGTAFYAEDSYTKSFIGLRESVDKRFAGDVSWAPGEKVSLYLHAGYQEIESEQAGSAAFDAPDWQAFHEDEFTTVGFGFSARELAEKFDLTFDYTRADGTTAITVDGGVFPDLESTMDSVRLELAWRASERMEWTAELRYESFSTEDWAIAGVEPQTVSSVLTLGADPYDYDVFLFGIGFRYRIGELEIGADDDEE